MHKKSVEAADKLDEGESSADGQETDTQDETKKRENTCDNIPEETTSQVL